MKTPSLAVVEAVSAKTGVDPRDLDPPLATVIDTTALDALVDPADDRSQTASIEVRFGYCGYRVAVRTTGAVTLEPL